MRSTAHVVQRVRVNARSTPIISPHRKPYVGARNGQHAITARYLRQCAVRGLQVCCLVGLLATMALWATVQPTYASANLCAQWAAQVSATRQGADKAYTLHAMGCAAPYGLWVPASGKCNRIAYHYTAHVRGNWQYAAIGKHGCVLYEDGAWGVQ